jgi:hypothetical protein
MMLKVWIQETRRRSLANVIGGLVGAGFDNWLDAVDALFCTFEGGDFPEEVNNVYFSIFYVLTSPL